MDIRGISPNQGKSGDRSRDSLNLTVLGVCTGSGLGHLNCALVRFGQKTSTAPLRLKLLQFDQVPLPSTVREPLVEYLRSNSRNSKSAPIDTLLGRLLCNGIKTFCRKHALDSTSIDFLGTHSEILKILHRHTNEAGAREDQTHWSSIVAAETDISTVFDFAVIESAFVRPHIRPIAYVERLFLQHSTKFRVCLNIEQISTLSFIPAYDDDGARATISRDCGPGSLLIDYAMRYCTSNNHSEDYDGKMASQGKVNQGIVDRFLDAHDYLRHPPAPNMVTEMFGDHEAQQLIDECLYNSLSEEDTLATITRITAQNILKQYQRLLQFCYPPDQKVDELFICGPGARNSCIIDYLEAELPESVITKPLHDIGIPGDAHEAVCYAYLALEAVLEEATHSAAPPPASNSTHPIADIVKATVTPGRRWEELVSQVLEFSDGQRLRIATDVRISGSLEAGVQGMGLR